MFGSGETGQESRGCGGLYLIPPHLSLPSVVVSEISRARGAAWVIMHQTGRNPLWSPLVSAGCLSLGPVCPGLSEPFPFVVPSVKRPSPPLHLPQ